MLQNTKAAHRNNVTLHWPQHRLQGVCQPFAAHSHQHRMVAHEMSLPMSLPQKLHGSNSFGHTLSFSFKQCLNKALLASLFQNDYDELHALLEWAVPGGLGDRHHFQEYYEAPIKMAQKKDIDDSALGRVSRLNTSTDKFVFTQVTVFCCDTPVVLAMLHNSHMHCTVHAASTSMPVS